MPLYEYQCDECGHTFEKIQKFSDPLETTCPKCGGPVRKLMSSPAIQFKGSGWYITDYARKDSAPAKSDTKAETKSEGKSEGQSEGKSESSGGAKSSETKSDTKTEAKSEPAKTTKPS
jgi:putative FmdB family regulatory protein